MSVGTGIFSAISDAREGTQTSYSVPMRAYADRDKSTGMVDIVVGLKPETTEYNTACKVRNAQRALACCGLVNT